MTALSLSTAWAGRLVIALATPRSQDPSITPNKTGLPGLGTASEIAGALLTVGLIACVAGIAVSGLVWAFAHHHGNGRYSDHGKSGVIVCCLAALLVGGADAIITFFSNMGGALH